MDLDEWEILPHDGFLGYHDKDGEKNIFMASKHSSNPKTVFNMDYFMCPSSPPGKSKAVPAQLVPVPIQLETARTACKDPEEKVIEEVTKVPIDISVVPPVIMPIVKDPKLGSKETDHDSVSQVFFKKMKENEFVDMKMDSPKSGTKAIVPPLSEDKIEAYSKGDEKENKKEVGKVIWEENNGGLNLWKWGFTGIGAICSFGVAAAATICIIILGSHQKNNQQQQNQNLRLQIYADDKRITQVVREATKLNEAISTARGVSITSADVTYGGYYNGL